MTENEKKRVIRDIRVAITMSNAYARNIEEIIHNRLNALRPILKEEDAKAAADLLEAICDARGAMNGLKRTRDKLGIVLEQIDTEG